MKLNRDKINIAMDRGKNPQCTPVHLRFLTGTLEEKSYALVLIIYLQFLSEKEAYMFHIEMWLYVHGIATAIATSYLEWNEKFISRVLTAQYMKGKSI